MRERLHTYSQVLQLNTETLLAYKYTPEGLMRALQMFTVVALVAGLGLWFGIPVQLDRPVLYEELDSAQVAIDSLAGSVEPFLAQNIPLLESPEELAASSEKARRRRVTPSTSSWKWQRRKRNCSAHHWVRGSAA